MPRTGKQTSACASDLGHASHVRYLLNKLVKCCLFVSQSYFDTLTSANLRCVYCELLCFRAKFFHEVKQYEQWMASDLHKAGTLMQKKDLQPNSHGDIANELLLEMKVFPPFPLSWLNVVSQMHQLDSFFLENRAKFVRGQKKGPGNSARGAQTHYIQIYYNNEELKSKN